jgi:formylglycine-generating enzyme required for sulfatase activity/CheY-like chemotaxis protein
MKILVVDDDTGVIQALLAILKSVPGYEVRVGTSGERALENAAAMGGVDLLITDVVMEPVDGFTLRSQVQRHYPAARTILISGYDLSEYAEQTQGCQVLAKPIDPQELLAAIEREFAAPPEPEPAPAPAPAPVRAARPVAGPQPAARPQPVARPVAQPRPQPAARPVAAQPAARPGAPRPVPRGPAPAAARPAGPMVRAIAVPAPVREPEAAPAETPVADEVAREAGGGEAEAIAEDAGLVGHTIGAYQIHRRLGQARWGAVYAAVQTAINRPVALKVLDPAHAHDAEARTRFISDARAKAHVQHPSTQAVYEAGESGGQIFYAYEYVEGETLAAIAEGGRKVDEAMALKILRTSAEGLAYLASHSIPHAPPTARSIYLGTDGAPRLANLATHSADEQLPVVGELQALGRILLSVLPALQMLKPGLRELIVRMIQPGPQAFVGWGQLLVAIKALEPKIVPVDAAKISAQDRAAAAAVAMLRKQQKRSMYINVASFISLVAVFATFSVLIYKKFFGTNERDMNAQVEIPAGEFIFGSGEPVTLDTYWIDKYEVTYGQYAKFVDFLKKNPARAKEFDDPRQPPTKAGHIPQNWDVFFGNAKAGHPVRSIPIDLNCPVMEVDWWDAAAYAKWRGRELPTEQEWEKAARGLKGFIYPWGEDANPKKANSNADHKPSEPAAEGKVDGFNFWNPVDAIRGDKSPFGVVGMAGNVAEWVGTWDPVKKRPLIKGGSFMASDLRLDRSSDSDPNTLSESIGFRTVTHTAPVKK